jgi:hypothetical protein
MTKEQSAYKLVKLSIECYKIEPSCDFIIISKDNQYTNIIINYINPNIFNIIEDLDFKIVNVRPHCPRSKIFITITSN